jgi:hypothetical protein
MAQPRADWFSTVATDLFASCFAAVLIIDSVTPKELGSSSRPVPIEIEYNLPAERRFLGRSRDPGTCLPEAAVVVSFDDRSGRRHSTLAMEGHWSPDGRQCRFVTTVSGLADDGITNLVLTIGAYPTSEEAALRVTIRTPLGECHLSPQSSERRQPC